MMGLTIILLMKILIQRFIKIRGSIMYKITVKNKLTDEIIDIKELPTPLDTLSWLDFNFLEVNNCNLEDLDTSAITVSAYLYMLEGHFINAVYKREDQQKEIYNLYLERI
jgi:hypothetical protein